jgi:hypothetical protein
MNPGSSLLLLAGAAVACLGVCAWAWRRRRLSPAEKERMRRLGIARYGRVAEGLVTDAQDGVLYYSYTARGVQYTTSQDVSALLDRLPAEPTRLLGPVTVKFLRQNPADSILFSEEWSGFRLR